MKILIEEEDLETLLDLFDASLSAVASDEAQIADLNTKYAAFAGATDLESNPELAAKFKALLNRTAGATPPSVNATPTVVPEVQSDASAPGAGASAEAAGAAAGAEAGAAAGAEAGTEAGAGAGEAAAT